MICTKTKIDNQAIAVLDYGTLEKEGCLAVRGRKMRKKLRPNILIADDSEISREILVSMLEKEYNVYEAADGCEVMEMLEGKTKFFQLILLDLNMPKLDGYSVLRQMKERDWLKELPVVIISTEIGIASQLGAVDFLSKPFDKDIVKTRIRNVLAIYERYTMDSLTGGLNSEGFIRQVQNFLQSGVDCTEYEILFFDIRNFKAINEILGMENGDKVLQHFYRSLVDAEFEPLAVSRIETDHFACLAKRQDDAYSYMDQICNQTYEQGGKLFQIRSQCGIFHIQEKEISVTGMLDRARIAKENCSLERKKNYEIYKTAMKSDYIDDAELISELSQGIDSEAFQVYYQPIIKVDTGEIASAEALVRWIHPEKGIVSPAAFIPVLEKNGEISKLDTYMIENVRDFQIRRQKAGKCRVPVSVNLSGVDFYDKEMRQKIMDFVEDDELQKRMLRFEIMETSYIAMDYCSLNFIKKMRAQGVKILMDDFGKGYSSLGLLNNCDIDILKIDKDFVQQIGENSKAKIILRSIINMAHQLGLKTVAEGVETKEQLDFLLECGCGYAQGYYFSRPLPEEKFIELLENRGY